ncbi:MAG TPA: DUF4389 domain-containing protein [Actinomycetota bacterium]|nr:DUF4389 domain-containing protein [Actinomycetota bacterium]
MRVGRIILIIFGALGVLVGLASLGGGGVLAWAYGTQRDDEGFITSRTERFTTSTHAITSEGVQVVDEWPLEGNLGTIRIRVTGQDPARRVFVGIARTRDLDRYLAGTSHDEIRDLSLDPFRVDYRRTEGGPPPTAPGDQVIWEARVAGAGTQALTWDVEGGSWSAVVMNADGAAGIAVDSQIGGKVSWLLGLTIGLLAFGVLSVGGGTLMIYLGARARGAGPPASPAGGAAVAPQPTATPEDQAAPQAPYPVRLTGELTEPLSRWLWLVKWLLAIPHYVVLFFLWIAFVVMSVVAFFAILFTGRYPRGIFAFNVGVLRWTWRVSFYSYSALGTDRYPPFSLEETDYPATLQVDYPETLSRGLVLVKWWLLAIPHFIVLTFLSGGWTWFADERGPDGGWWFAPIGGGLIGVLTIFAGVALLFTARYPKDIFALVIGFNRWVYRVLAYVGLMRDEYPPFRLRP